LAAVGVALVSAAVPAVRAARLEIVDALAGR
jgi:ABC-type lipoprotein release transport system permease subunit